MGAVHVRRSLSCADTGLSGAGEFGYLDASQDPAKNAGIQAVNRGLSRDNATEQKQTEEHRKDKKANRLNLRSRPSGINKLRGCPCKMDSVQISEKYQEIRNSESLTKI